MKRRRWRSEHPGGHLIGRPKANAGSGRGRPPASNGDLIRDGTRVDETGLHMAPEPRHHRRNTGPMLASPRCGARTRSGEPCRAPAVRGKKVCRMHGGVPGSGAPKGNQNALKHGRYTRKAIARRRRERPEVREERRLARLMFRRLMRKALR